MKHVFARTLIFAASVSLLVSGCGNPSDEVPSEWNELVDQHGLSPTIKDIIAQSEITKVIEEVNTHVLGTAGAMLDPGAINGARAASATSCKPKVTIVGLGANLEFAAGGTCFFQGTISVKLFPLQTTVDLKVVGLSFIQSITLKGEITLDGSSSISLLFQDGRINLNLGGLLPDTTLVLSGRSTFEFGAGATEINARTNAFEATTRAGLAIVVTIKGGSSSSKKVDSCFLTGGDAMNPDAGELKFCFALLK